jgi:tetratricopeptide (TPR) repeat protein
MMLKDYRGLEISGATPDALDSFERALDAHLSWRTGVEQHLEQTIAAAPAFTMAHVLSAYSSIFSRDPALVRQAQRAHAIASSLRATAREHLHVAATGAALADDFRRVKDILGRLLEQYPRDVLALQVGHALDYLTGDIESMHGRVAAVLPAWSEDTRGYHAVLAMHAFSLVEFGEYDAAVDHGLRALDLAPWDARAHHALTHVYEMTGDATGGIRWMRERRPFWAHGTVAATHCWWHWALFHLTLGQVPAALEIYDHRVRASRSPAIADMIDASSLLWRIELQSQGAGSRWPELAAAWAGHIEDHYCTFNDMHAILALVGARDWNAAKRLEAGLLANQGSHTRYGETTRLLGLAVCRAFIAFGRGDYGRAAKLLDKLPPAAHRFGGSQAQRHILHLTLLEAARRQRQTVPSVAASEENESKEAGYASYFEGARQRAVGTPRMDVRNLVRGKGRGTTGTAKRDHGPMPV